MLIIASEDGPIAGADRGAEHTEADAATLRPTRCAVSAGEARVTARRLNEVHAARAAEVGELAGDRADDRVRENRSGDDPGQDVGGGAEVDGDVGDRDREHGDA